MDLISLEHKHSLTAIVSWLKVVALLVHCINHTADLIQLTLNSNLAQIEALWALLL